MVTLLHRIGFALFLSVLLAAPASAELLPKNLLLVVNRNDPDGVALATYYARARAVPPAQIIQLDLPTGNEISIDEYERDIADPIRVALQSAAYAGDVKCIVTFLGVPFRIPPRPKEANPAIDAELKLIATHLADAQLRLNASADKAERLTRDLDPGFTPPAGLDPVRRVHLAAERAKPIVEAMADSPGKRSIEGAWKSLLADIRQPIDLAEPPTTSPAVESRAAIAEALRAGAVRMHDAHARQMLREDSRRAGAIIYMQILELQQDYLSNDQTDAAVDSELACVRWKMYRRTRWQGNPLRFNAEDSAAAPATLMVMRLDGPGGAALIRKRIDEGIATEKLGLRGNIVLDSRNIPLRKADGQIDGYGIYDESLRNLREILRAADCTLPVIFDESDKLIADDSLKDIAVYCGWYDPDKVHLPGMFVTGSVGFHVASYTAVAIRGIGGGLWTPSMFHAGVVNTLGAVSEPYLSAFPLADEYVPLLLTGKLTMAEVYWRTAPMTSWKIVVLGDPLYNPFKNAPAVELQALPPAFSAAIDKK